MRVYTIKHTGKNHFGNMHVESSRIIKETKIYIGLLFFRKKDANRYLNTFDHKGYYEVIGMTMDKSIKDNRVWKK